MSKARTSLLLRLTASRIPPLLSALLVLVVIMTILTAVFLVEGIALVWGNYDGYIELGLAFTYMVYVTRLIHNSHVKDFGLLLSHADLNEPERDEWRHKMNDHRSQLVETLAAMAVGLMHAYMQGHGRVLTGESRFPINDIWASLLVVLIWIVITQSTSIFIRNMTLLNELSEKVKIDLLNMERFMPLTRSGVWSILGFVGVYSILFMQGMDHISLSDPAVLVLAPSVFWMIRTPLKGFRKRVVQAKERELTIIDAAIEGDREALKQSRISANLDNINVIDLINYKKMIHNTFEIPVNIPTASRFVFYLIIPLLTWIAASMVDKLIDYLIK